MDNFERHENKGRRKLEAIFNSSDKVAKYEFTTGKFDRLDCFTTGYSGNLTAYEIKDRDISSTLYPDYILEVPKYKALMAAYDDGYTPYYINFFADNTVILWDVSKIDITNRVIKKPCTRTTAENYGNRVEKEVVLLRPEEGRRIKVQFN